MSPYFFLVIVFDQMHIRFFIAYTGPRAYGPFDIEWLPGFNNRYFRNPCYEYTGRLIRHAKTTSSVIHYSEIQQEEPKLWFKIFNRQLLPNQASASEFFVAEHPAVPYLWRLDYAPGLLGDSRLDNIQQTHLYL